MCSETGMDPSTLAYIQTLMPIHHSRAPDARHIPEEPFSFKQACSKGGLG